MTVFSLPYNNREQEKVCIALKNISGINYNLKNELDRIQRNLKYGQLNESEKVFLKDLIKKYGSRINI